MMLVGCGGAWNGVSGKEMFAGDGTALVVRSSAATSRCPLRRVLRIAGAGMSNSEYLTGSCPGPREPPGRRFMGRCAAETRSPAGSRRGCWPGRPAATSPRAAAAHRNSPPALPVETAPQPRAATAAEAACPHLLMSSSLCCDGIPAFSSSSRWRGENSKGLSSKCWTGS